MPQEVKLWRVHAGDKLEPYKSTALDLEQRLERWIEADISVLSPDLLVIGTQVDTGFGRIDLLCLDSQGNTVIVELKKDRTPREVTAQVLEYASWVRTLSSERLTEIASEFLGPDTALEDAFAEKFNDELPDVLNEDHRMIVVGSRIDASTERIIQYLSEAHRVGINAASFQFLAGPDGGSTLARVFLIEPSQVDQQARGRASSKRLPRLTEAELLEQAEEAGVSELYGACVHQLRGLFDRISTSRSSLRFKARIGKKSRRRVVLSLLPSESSKARGLRFELYWEKLRQAFDLEGLEPSGLLPANREAWDGRSADPANAGFTGCFKSEADVSRFVNQLAQRQKPA